MSLGDFSKDWSPGAPLVSLRTLDLVRLDVGDTQVPAAPPELGEHAGVLRGYVGVHKTKSPTLVQPLMVYTNLNRPPV